MSLGRVGEKACIEGDGNFQFAKSNILDKREQHKTCVYDQNNHATLPTSSSSSTVLMNVVFKCMSVSSLI